MPPLSFPEVMAMLSKFQEALGNVHSSLTLPNEREMLGGILEQLQTQRAKAEELFPQVMGEMKKTAEESRAKAEAMQSQIEQGKAEAAELLAKSPRPAPAKERPAAAPKPEAKIDPTLGQQLRQELLEKFGGPAAPEKAGRAESEREIWEDWDWNK